MNITILTVGPRGDVQPTWPWLAGSAGPGSSWAGSPSAAISTTGGVSVWGWRRWSCSARAGTSSAAGVLARGWAALTGARDDDDLVVVDELPRQMLTVDRLATAIQAAVTDPAMRARAVALGRRIQAEDGIIRAVQAVQSHHALDEQAPEATSVLPAREGSSTVQGGEVGDGNGQR